MASVTPAERTYRNFELRIREAGPDGLYPVEASAAGEAQGHMRLPLSRDEVAALLARCESGSLAEAEVAALGRQLRDAAFSQPMTFLMGQALGDTSNGLRLRLWIDAPELAALPWEFLQGVDSAAGRFLALTPRVTLSRYLPVERPPEPLAVDGPLQVLVVRADPSDLPPLDTAGTAARIQQALAPLADKVAVRVLEHATTDQLQDALQQPVHVLHFAGHGQFREAAGQSEGLLAFEDEDGAAAWISATRLGYLLGDGTVRLAYLDACQTGQASGAAADGSSRPGLGVAQALVQAGLSAVVAMRFSIPDAAARKFAAKFYAALANGYPVDAAVAEGRRAVMLDGSLAWGTPVLFLRAPDGQVFRRPTAQPATQATNTPAGGSSVTIGSISGVSGDAKITISGHDTISNDG